MPSPSDAHFSLIDLESFDPGVRPGERRRFCCPLCGADKPRDAAHRSLSLETSTGLWKCFRCGVGGIMLEHRHASEGFKRTGSARHRLQAAFGMPNSPSPPKAIKEQRETSSDSRVGERLQPIKSLEVEQPTMRELPLAKSKAVEEPAIGDQAVPRWLKLWESSLPLTDVDAAMRYLRSQRGLSLDVAQCAGLRFCPHWPGGAAVVFPLAGLNGETVAIQGRSIAGANKITYGPRKHSAFWAPSRLGSGRIIRPLDTVFDSVILVEAPVDALSLALVGFPALALCGTSGPDWLPIACGLRRVFLAFDADDAGDKAHLECQRLLEPYGTRCVRMRPQGGKDWNEILMARGADELADLVALQVL